ncbi:TPA: hypothetical protein DDZ01_03330 [Candidatus Uhrbacteria bacterium]|nr:MAG: Thiamine biosynthesis protein ThiF [Candidatus Uhrbacteria bacterium GW2011_GWF2_40_263]OGL97409.1 MAG: hypothetical protein A2332_04805 [Candidatus Uhrbacteria bacterium RIFOXYB2_FULL_41_18]HBK35000.1 hypothetical protein [Candidatus Uhrbacteria bacterium]HCB56154.1 hypothetical protein [Candidatus Uhrbacteria bacterium]
MITPLRHLSVFSPDEFGDRRVDVIGLGATGSRITLELARLGIRNLHGWDYDTVSEVNLANQAFAVEDIGRLKAEATARLVKANTGLDLQTHVERVDGTQVLGEIVFVLPDTMASRREIFERGLRMKLRTKLMIETRMGADSLRVYTFNPSRPAHIRAYQDTFHDDVPQVTSVCGGKTSVGATAETISGIAVWQLIRWFSIVQGADDVLDNEIIFSLRPPMLVTRTF